MHEKVPTIVNDVPTISEFPKILSVTNATNVVPIQTATKLLISKKTAEICARIWLGASICIAVVEIGIGNDAKNMAGTSSVTDSQSSDT